MKEIYVKYIKRALDLMVALLLIVMTAPVMLVLVVWLHFANEGAGVFFVQERPGKDEKIINQTVLEKTENMDYSKFFDYVREMCESLDCPTPVIIKTHIFNYAKYNSVKFTNDDFLENISFDKLIIENLLL